MGITGKAVMALVAVVALSGCGDDAEGDGPESTDRSLAAVTIDEIGLPVEYATHAYLKGYGAEHGGLVRFAAGSSANAPELSTLVLPASSTFADRWCDDEPIRGCVVDTLDDGRDVLLKWELEEPEEDPGLVLVAVVGDEGIVQLNYHGDPITTDPREPGVMPDGLGVDDLFELAASPRLGPRATEADHEAGEDLESWVDDEPDTSSS